MDEKLQISVAGIRGVYPDILNTEIAFNFGVVFGSFVKTKTVFVCRDTRLSGESLKDAMVTGLLCTGKDVIDLGVAPTPQVGYLIEKNGNSCGVVITASHNPGEYNGIKFLSEKGTFLNEKEGARLLEIYEDKAFTVPGTAGLLSSGDYTEEYFSDIYNAVNTRVIREKKFKVVVDVCQGVGALYSRKFLEGMGCEALIINSEPHGVFAHNPEPLPENIEELSGKVLEEKAHIGFAQDPDGDRLSLVCEDGTIPGEEFTVVLCVANVLGQGLPGPVVVNLSTTSAVEETASGFGVHVCRTKIGEVNVVEKMKAEDAVIGGEGNGGVIYPRVHYGRDSFVGMALILEYLALNQKSASSLVAGIPRFVMLKKKIKADKKIKDTVIKEVGKKYSAAGETVDFQDGVKIIRKDGWVHIRPSGTEPVIRLYVEGRNGDIAHRYMSEFISLFSD